VRLDRRPRAGAHHHEVQPAPSDRVLRHDVVPEGADLPEHALLEQRLERITPFGRADAVQFRRLTEHRRRAQHVLHQGPAQVVGRQVRQPQRGEQPHLVLRPAGRHVVRLPKTVRPQRVRPLGQHGGQEDDIPLVALEVRHGADPDLALLPVQRALAVASRLLDLGVDATTVLTKCSPPAGAEIFEVLFEIRRQAHSCYSGWAGQRWWRDHLSHLLLAAHRTLKWSGDVQSPAKLRAVAAIASVVTEWLADDDPFQHWDCASPGMCQQC
jgi:Ternary complex associated domain 9